MRITPLVVVIYSLLLLIGGWMGHRHAGSVPSLIAGLSSGVVLLICAIAMFQRKKWGHYAALIFTFFLDSFFTYRFAKTLHFLPSGLMSLVSLAVLILLAVRARKFQ